MTDEHLREEYEELKKVMDYVNSLPFVEGKFSKIKFGDKDPKGRDAPILICQGNPSFRIDYLHPIYLARNYSDPRRINKGTYLTVDIPFDILKKNFSYLIADTVKKKHDKQDDRRLFFDKFSGWQYHPIESKNMKEQVETFYLSVRDFVRISRNHEIKRLEDELKENIENLFRR